jgi:hypothetical protein
MKRSDLIGDALRRKPIPTGGIHPGEHGKHAVPGGAARDHDPAKLHANDQRSPPRPSGRRSPAIDRDGGKKSPKHVHLGSVGPLRRVDIEEPCRRYNEPDESEQPPDAHGSNKRVANRRDADHRRRSENRSEENRSPPPLVVRVEQTQRPQEHRPQMRAQCELRVIGSHDS